MIDHPRSAAVAADAAEPLAGTVLMVRPAAFGPNLETAATNRFQRVGAKSVEIAARARAEFDALADALAAAGIEVIAVEDSADPPKPDAVFPNNWFTTHADGTLVLYPMLAPSRRAERRPELAIDLMLRSGRQVTAVLDLSPWERSGLALEGTGSLVLDRRRRIAYACRSPRTAEAPLAQWARFLGYDVHAFDALDSAGVPIYHTNVMMALGRDFAAVALAALPHEGERRALQARLEADGYEVVALSPGQVSGFAGNLLQLEGSRGPVIAMSESARRHMGSAVLARLERYGSVVAAPIPTIERFGGGSVRCMLAEIFLPRFPV